MVMILSILAGMLGPTAHGVEITAHRGASHLAPENTLAAVELAWKLNADSVEIDVYLSKDRQIVVIHDNTTKRTAGIDWKVAEHTAAELRTLDVGSWKDEKFCGQKIPTLEEVLATIPAGKRLLIEIKCKAEIVPLLKETLDRSGTRAAEAAVISFDFDVVAAAKRAMPERTVLWLLSATPKRDKETGRVLVTLAQRIAKCRSAGLDGLSVSCKSELNKSFVKQVHDAGLLLHVWTVNSAEETKRLITWGVDAITTDRPGWMIQELTEE